MGKAARWLRGILGMKREKETVETPEKREKKRWSFCKSAKDSHNFRDASWLRTYIADTEREQTKHAIAMAAATAAAADAAVAAAQAAVAVVRLSGHGKGVDIFAGARKKLAAVRIQTVFRGYLARKALRALKGLVKLQALVRGYLVRKRATDTLHSMQALFRAQAFVRAHMARRSVRDSILERHYENRANFNSKRIYGWCDHPGLDECPKIVEMDTGRPKSWSRRMRSTSSMSDYNDDHHQNCHDFSAPLPWPNPARLSTPDVHESDWGFVVEDYKFPTAQNTPRLGRGFAPVTPSKSLCGDNKQCYSNSPGYMASTQSFEAKLRSQSVPRQRPECGPKKSRSLSEMIMASRNSCSGIRMQRSCPRVHEDLEF